MYFHPKLAWPPATHDVKSRNHSNWPRLNLSQNLRGKFGLIYEIISRSQGVEFRNPSSPDKEYEASTWNPESTKWNPVIQNPRLYWILGLNYLTRGYTSVDRNMQHSTLNRHQGNRPGKTQHARSNRQLDATRKDSHRISRAVIQWEFLPRELGMRGILN